MYVQFNEQKKLDRPEQNRSVFVRTLMQFGLVSNQAQANFVLMIIALVLMAVAFVIWHTTTTSDNPANDLTPEQLEQAGAPSEIAN